MDRHAGAPEHRLTSERRLVPGDHRLRRLQIAHAATHLPAGFTHIDDQQLVGLDRPGLRRGGDALARVNRFLAMNRQWKADNLRPLAAMYAALLRPENATLYHRIVGAVFAAISPLLRELIADGAAEGVFHPADVDLAAEALLWL